MSSKSVDTKLARQLQKRGTWDCYSNCLREVQKYLALPEWSNKQIREMIDAGQLDPGPPREAK